MYGNFVHATNDASHYTTPPTGVHTVIRDVRHLGLPGFKGLEGLSNFKERELAN